jgi:hypothetical protein
MRKVLLSTVAALSVVGFTGVASAQNVNDSNFSDDFIEILNVDTNGDVGGVENVIAVSDFQDAFPEFSSPEMEECTVCTRFDTVDEIADKAMNKGYDYVNVQFRNTAYGDINIDDGSGILDQNDFRVGRDLEVSTSALAGVQANVWEVSNSGLDDVNDGQIPNTGLNVQYSNYAGGTINSPDGIAEELSGTSTMAARDVTISTTAMAGVQANIVRAGNLALETK